MKGSYEGVLRRGLTKGSIEGVLRRGLSIVLRFLIHYLYFTVYCYMILMLK